mmetsp:Transcript_21949/g.37538  ORF Transcript_21949/g.37538 Transcript_21949/m.37538 type:complete len:89 (+) Transcript_21949:148-414(+)
MWMWMVAWYRQDCLLGFCLFSVAFSYFSRQDTEIVDNGKRLSFRRKMAASCIQATQFSSKATAVYTLMSLRIGSKQDGTISDTGSQWS